MDIVEWISVYGTMAVLVLLLIFLLVIMSMTYEEFAAVVTELVGGL